MIRRYDSWYVSEVWFGVWFAWCLKIWLQNQGMIRGYDSGHDSGYDSRPVVINSAFLGNTLMCIKAPLLWYFVLFAECLQKWIGFKHVQSQPPQAYILYRFQRKSKTMCWREVPGVRIYGASMSCWLVVEPNPSEKICYIFPNFQDDYLDYLGMLTYSYHHLGCYYSNVTSHTNTCASYHDYSKPQPECTNFGGR